jgi:hypothetical protein
MIRSIFRLVKYIQGNNGYLLRHGTYLCIFGALLIFVTMVIYNLVHPHEIGRLQHSHIDYDMVRFPDEQAAKPYEMYPGE